HPEVAVDATRALAADGFHRHRLLQPGVSRRVAEDDGSTAELAEFQRFPIRMRCDRVSRRV
ncbi:MAG: hypothetical protein ACSLE6_01480, partial [Mycobacterium sp.]